MLVSDKFHHKISQGVLQTAVLSMHIRISQTGTWMVGETPIRSKLDGNKYVGPMNKNPLIASKGN